MPVNKNALIRYKTIDKCLRNRYRRWTIEDLVDACSDALYEMEGIDKGVSMRTVQGDIQIMRSDKLGYNAPIEVYENKFYRYADPEYSINENPLNAEDYDLMEKAVCLIGEIPESEIAKELKSVLSKLKGKYCCPVKVLHGKKIRLKPSCRIPASFVTLLVAKKTVVT